MPDGVAAQPTRENVLAVAEPEPKKVYQLISREEARKAGWKRYYDGKLCRKGHDSDRYVSSGICCKCTYQSRFDYGRLLEKQRDKQGNYIGWHPTDIERNLCREMVANGIPRPLICKVLGVSEPLLRKHCQHDLDTGWVEANNRVANSLFFMATEGPIQQRLPAAIFWLKVRAGWREVEYLELLRSPSEMTDDELDKAISLAKGAKTTKVKGSSGQGQGVADLAAFRARKEGQG